MQEKVQIKNLKGQNIEAVIHRSETKTEKLAILCPGFLDSKDYDHLVKLAEVLSGRGYTAVRFDPIGTWGSGGDIGEYTTTQYLKDIKSVKDYMLSKERDYRHILLGGHSMGGRMALLYAPTDSDISFVLSIMSSSKKKNIANEYNDKWRAEGVQINNRDIPGSAKEKRQYLLPFSFLEDSDKYNVLDNIKQLHISILFIAGQKDVLCPPSIVKTIFDNANQPKKFIIIDNIGHDYRHYADQIKMVNDAVVANLDLK